jgi:hypothetical protein
MSTVPSPQSSPSFLPPQRRSKTRQLVIGTLIGMLAAIVLWNCGKGAYHNYRLSSAAVDYFHQLLNQGDFETIYGETTDGFRRAGTRENEIKFFATVHDKMGNAGKMSAKGFHINWQNGVLSVDQVYETQFTLGQAQESFIWYIQQDQARLYSYRIDSPNLR